MTLLETLRLIKSDYVRMAAHYNFRLTPQRAIGVTILPPTIALILYRFSHYFVLNGMGFFGWPLYSLNVMVTGADIHPRSAIGPGCLIGHAPGIIITGRIGKNATLLAKCGVGGGPKNLDVGAGFGLPVLGDNVTICACANVMGSVRIGDGAIIGVCSLAIKDVPAGATIVGVPGRIVRSQSEPMFAASAADETSAHQAFPPTVGQNVSKAPAATAGV